MEERTRGLQTPTFPNSNLIWIIAKHFIKSLWLGRLRNHSSCYWPLKKLLYFSLLLKLHFWSELRGERLAHQNQASGPWQIASLRFWRYTTIFQFTIQTFVTKFLQWKQVFQCAGDVVHLHGRATCETFRLSPFLPLLTWNPLLNSLSFILECWNTESRMRGCLFIQLTNSALVSLPF